MNQSSNQIPRPYPLSPLFERKLTHSANGVGSDLWLQGMNDNWLLMGDIPDRAAHMQKDRPALVFQGERWTHGEFADDVQRVAKGLMLSGVEHGDHVAVWMTNRLEWLQLMYAIPRVGACIVPLNTRYRTDDVAYTVVQSESKFLIALDRSGPIDYGEMVEAALPQLDEGGHLRQIVMMGEQLKTAFLGRQCCNRAPK